MFKWRPDHEFDQSGVLGNAFLDSFQRNLLAWQPIHITRGIELESESIRYPDIIVDAAGEAPKDLTATAPVLIAEVLSPSSERIDLGDKSSEYLRLPSLAAYCVFAQDAIKAWVWTRGRGGFPPGPELFEGESAVIRIEALALDPPKLPECSMPKPSWPAT